MTSNVELTSLRIGVIRWEHVTVASPDLFDRLERVESWEAVFDAGGRRRSTVPTEHTLVTTNPDTWSNRDWMDGSGYDAASSDLFVVYVYARAPGKGNSGWGWATEDWVIDCAQLGEVVDFVPFTHWNEIGWSQEQGNL